MVLVSRGSWSLSWKKKTISPPSSNCNRRAVWNLANRNRFGKNPHGCWPKQMTGVGFIASKCFRALVIRAEHGVQNEAQQHAPGAPDEVIPEVTDVERKKEDEHHCLRRHRRPEDGRA